MNEAEHLYRESQEAILSLVNESNQDTPVPACPGWSAKDVIAHLTGALIDLSTGNTEGAPSPAWTASHVERYRDSSLEAIASALRDAADSPAAKSLYGKIGVHLLPDVVTHEFDIRGALGNGDNRESAGLQAIYPVVTGWLNGAFEKKGLPAITISSEVDPVVVGEGMPQATLVSTLFELSRVFTGRRSVAQVAAMDWSVDPAPWASNLSVLGQRDTDLVE